MNNYREIVTKAVIGKLKKNSVDNIKIDVENNADTILGCWIINHKFNGYLNNNYVDVNGSYDVNVWYSFDNNTKTDVVKYTYNYVDTLKIDLDDNLANKEVVVRSLTQPSVSEAKIDNSSFNLIANKELAIEVIGDTKIKVPIEVVDDDYIEVSNNNDVNIEEINENYLDN